MVSITDEMKRSSIGILESYSCSIRPMMSFRSKVTSNDAQLSLAILQLLSLSKATRDGIRVSVLNFGEKMSVFQW